MTAKWETTGSPKWHWRLWQIPKKLCSLVTNTTSLNIHLATENTSAQRRIVTHNSWEKSVSSLPLMFCQKRNGCDLFKMWIHFLMAVCSARGTRLTHLSTETTFLCWEFFLSEWGFRCWMAGVMSQSTWEGCGPGKRGVRKWRRAVVIDALSSVCRTRWHVFNLSPAAPVDRAGWDFTPPRSRVCACVQGSESGCKT